MTLTTHTAIGVAIGTVVGSPVAGLFLGLISHFLVDMIPHGDNNIAEKYFKHQKKRGPLAYVTVDAVTAIILLMFAVGARPDAAATTNLAFASAVVGSILPDLLVAVGELFKHPALKKFYNFHLFFHNFFSGRYGDTKLSYALFGQAVFVIAIMMYFVS